MTANTIGNMTHTAAVRTDISYDDTFSTLGRRVARAVATAPEASFVPVEKALSTVKSVLAEHSVMFVYNKLSMTIELSRGSDLSRDMFDLMLIVTEDTNGLPIGAHSTLKDLRPTSYKGSPSPTCNCSYGSLARTPARRFRIC